MMKKDICVVPRNFVACCIFYSNTTLEGYVPFYI